MNREQVNSLIEQAKEEINSNRDDQFGNLENRLSRKIKNLEQILQRGSSDDFEEDDIELIKPYDRDISMETRPQLSSSELKKNNDHMTHLSNHELHQINSIYEKDHRRPIRTILDEPLGNILDNTINFLVYSFDNFNKKIYEAELMEDGKDESSINKMKIYLIAFILFIRDEQNIIYFGIFMVFISIIIYFINIITINV
jgi:hypothetical protein